MASLAEIAATTEVYQRFLFFPEDEFSLKSRGFEDQSMARSMPADNNIVGLCTQFKYVEGKATDIPTITFIVKKKKSRAQLTKSQQFKIPPELPAFNTKKGRFSREMKIQTDVEESNGIFLCSRAKQKGIYVARKRPAPGGFSVGNARGIATGTLGFWVELVGKGVVGVSNYHVLAPSNARKGDRIVQPGLLDHHPGSRNTIGRLLEFFEYKKGGNLVDLACLTPTNLSEANPFDIEGVGKCNGFTKPLIGMKVAKVGRTTGYTEGEIQANDATFRAPLGEETLLFIKQLKTTCELREGDSGAALIELKSKKICGLCVATEHNGEASFANNIRYLFGRGSVSGWEVKE